VDRLSSTLLAKEKQELRSIPPYFTKLLDVLKFTGARGELRSFTDSEWRQILSHWSTVRLTLPLSHRFGDDLPDWVRGEIDKNIADNTERYRRIKTDYLEIANALQKAGIEHVVLKGFAQWPACMQGPHLRGQADIDLYFPPETVFSARDVVCSLGYAWHEDLELKFGDHLLPLEKQIDWQWRGKHFDPDIPVSIELHFRFWNEATTHLRPMGLEQFWFRRIKRQFDGLVCPALDEGDALAYSALHALRHLLSRHLPPYHVYDIAWFLHSKADDATFWKKRGELHHDSLRLLEAVAFRLAKEWFACRLPEELEIEIRSLPAGVQRWFQEYADSPLIALLRSNKDVLWLHLNLLDRRSDKRSILWKSLLPAPRRHEKPVARWTMLNYSQYLIHAISRVPHHLRPLPRMLRHGFHRWWSTLLQKNA